MCGTARTATAATARARAAAGAAAGRTDMNPAGAAVVRAETVAGVEAVATAGAADSVCVADSVR